MCNPGGARDTGGVEYTIVWGGDPEDVRVTTSGVADMSGTRRWTEEILADAHYRQGLRLLVDHRALDWSGLTADSLRRRIADAEHDPRIGRHRIAYVVSRPVDFGVVRMGQLMAAGRTQSESAVFYDPDEARAWLGEPQAS